MLGTITLLLAQALSSWAAEPEWPRFRGRNGEGVVTGADIPASWKVDDFIWKIDLPGVGHGSVAIVGERIFLLCGDPRTSERTVVAVSQRRQDPVAEVLPDREVQGASLQFSGLNNAGS